MKKVRVLGLCIFVVCLFMHIYGEAETLGAVMEKGELEALYSAIQDFVGKWWNGLDLYPDPCGWTPIQGVSCDLFNGFWYVTEFSIGPLHENSLACAPNVEFSPRLFALTHLKSLSFFKCFALPRQLPVSIPAHGWEAIAGTLESLEFRSNDGLAGNIPTSFGELRNLLSLVVTENGLTGELPESMGNLVNLQRLNLARNSFTGKIPGTLGGLTQLLILDIGQNCVSSVLPSALGGMTSLLKLDLSSNRLMGKIPGEMGNLKELTLLDLSNNNISSGLTQPLQELKSLQELVLSNNPIGGDMMGPDWTRLKCLVVLDLANTSLTGVIPGSIAELIGLRFLGLNDNKLTGNIPGSLASLPNIGAMYIHGNNLAGRLEFPAPFYGKMGRRFGAWDNPNLCYPTGLGLGLGLTKTRNVPVGVKQCDEGIMRFEAPLEDNGNSWGASCGLGLLIEVFLLFIF